MDDSTKIIVCAMVMLIAGYIVAGAASCEESREKTKRLELEVRKLELERKDESHDE